ncbi:MAG: hypothetical protein ACJ8CR_33045 [Roseiflexaceae bacterium]
MEQQQYTTLVDVLKQVPDAQAQGATPSLADALVSDCGGVASAQRTPQVIARWVTEDDDAGRQNHPDPL